MGRLMTNTAGSWTTAPMRRKVGTVLGWILGLPQLFLACVFVALNDTGREDNAVWVAALNGVLLAGTAIATSFAISRPQVATVLLASWLLAGFVLAIVVGHGFPTLRGNLVAWLVVIGIPQGLVALLVRP